MKRLGIAVTAVLALTALGGCGQQATPGAAPAATSSATAGSTSSAPVATSSSAQSTASAAPSSATSSGSASAAPNSQLAQRGVTRANLPTSSDLEWFKAGDWRQLDGGSGLGQSTLSTCQQDTPQFDGARSFRADFELPKSGGSSASALVTSFDTAEQAQEARKAVLSWRGNGCQGTDSEPDQVPAAGNDASFVEYTKPLDAKTGEALFVSIGAVVEGNRLAVVTMEVVGQDNNWDFKPNGEVGQTHPMIRTLPKVADRLSR